MALCITIFVKLHGALLQKIINRDACCIDRHLLVVLSPVEKLRAILKKKDAEAGGTDHTQGHLLVHEELYLAMFKPRWMRKILPYSMVSLHLLGLDMSYRYH